MIAAVDSLPCASVAVTVMALGPDWSGTLVAVQVSVPTANPLVVFAAFDQATPVAPVVTPFSSSVLPPSESSGDEVLHVGAVVGVRIDRQGAYVTTRVGRFTSVPYSSEANLNSAAEPDS